MAGKGKKFVFHGSFSSKKEAVAKEQEVPGSFVLKRGKHFLVVTRRDNPGHEKGFNPRGASALEQLWRERW
jgi:hypothetical protein